MLWVPNDDDPLAPKRRAYDANRPGHDANFYNQGTAKLYDKGTPSAHGDPFAASVDPFAVSTAANSARSIPPSSRRTRPIEFTSEFEVLPQAIPASRAVGSTAPAFAAVSGRSIPQIQRVVPIHESLEASTLMGELNIAPHEAPIFEQVIEAALQSDLPPPWKKEVDPLGTKYYRSTDTLAITWQSPLLPYIKQVVEVGRKYMKGPSPDFFKEQKTMLGRLHSEELRKWHGPVQDGSGNAYFVNSVTHDASWHDPRLIAQSYFEIHSKLLHILATTFNPANGRPFEDKSTLWEAQDALEEMSLLEGHPMPQKRLGEKALQVQQKLEESQDHLKERSEHLEKMSPVVEWVRETVRNDEDRQRSLIEKRRAEKLEHRKCTNLGREIGEIVITSPLNEPIFLGTAPLEHHQPWSEDWPRDHVGWKPWELWTHA
jgi:chaperonin cofactor prefoldin